LTILPLLLCGAWALGRSDHREPKKATGPSNARCQQRLEAGAERTLEGVGCTPLILNEAPSSAYLRGMLVVGE
jgi:hypothetical protein